MLPGCISQPQVYPEAKTTVGWQHSVELASVKPGADLWCSNNVETSGVFQRDCNWVVTDFGVCLCALAYQIAPASTCMSRVTCHGLELLVAMQDYLLWLGVFQAVCYLKLLLQMTVTCRATCTIRGYVGGEVCVHCWPLQRLCLVGNSLLQRPSVCMICCMMWLWVLAIVCASAPEWAWVVTAALTSTRAPQ